MNILLGCEANGASVKWFLHLPHRRADETHWNPGRRKPPDWWHAPAIPTLRQAYEMSKYIQEISFYQMLIPEYRSLAHPNAQIDNAMFWKNESGVLECGLIDPWPPIWLSYFLGKKAGCDRHNPWQPTKDGILSVEHWGFINGTIANCSLYRVLWPFVIHHVVRVSRFDEIPAVNGAGPQSIREKDISE